MRILVVFKFVYLLYIVVISMKVVLNKFKGSDFLEEMEEELVMESNFFVRGRF